MVGVTGSKNLHLTSRLEVGLSHLAYRIPLNPTLLLLPIYNLPLFLDQWHRSSTNHSASWSSEAKTNFVSRATSLVQTLYPALHGNTNPGPVPQAKGTIVIRFPTAGRRLIPLRTISNLLQRLLCSPSSRFPSRVCNVSL